MGDFDWILPLDTRRWSSELDRRSASSPGEPSARATPSSGNSINKILFHVVRPSRKTESFHSSSRLLCHQVVANRRVPWFWPSVFVNVAFYWVSYDHNLLLIAFSIHSHLLNTLSRPIIKFYLFLHSSASVEIKKLKKKLQETLIYWHHCYPCSSSCATASLISHVLCRLSCEPPTGVHASSSITGEWNIFMNHISLLQLQSPSCARIK